MGDNSRLNHQQAKIAFLGSDSVDVDITTHTFENSPSSLDQDGQRFRRESYRALWQKRV